MAALPCGSSGREAGRQAQVRRRTVDRHRSNGKKRFQNLFIYHVLCTGTLSINGDSYTTLMILILIIIN